METAMPDSDKNEEPRVYGQADDGNRTPPAPQGMRGENGDTLAPADPEQVHEERVAGGRRIVVEEVSGTAFAESSGRAGLAQERAKADDGIG
jgi:hypothetical protein